MFREGEPLPSFASLSPRKLDKCELMATNPVIIRSSVFSSYLDLRFGLSTRNGGISPAPLGLNLSFSVGDVPENVQRNRALFFGALGIEPERVAFPGQVHSDVVERVSRPGRMEQCDALTTNAKELYLAISIADCLPIFLYDPVNSCIAAIHSGWRGSKGKIVSRAIQRMAELYASDPRNLMAFIGPGAGVCCYEVGEDVAGQFPGEYAERATLRKPHLDLKRWNADLLLESGVLRPNTEISDDCTICDERFHSYRRDGSRSGRMLGVIGMDGN